MDYVRTHALSGTLNGVGLASKRPSHPSRSDDNSRVALLVCDERLLAFVYTTLKGMARWSPQQIDPGRKRYTGDAAEVRMSPGVSQHIVREGGAL